MTSSLDSCGSPAATSNDSIIGAILGTFMVLLDQGGRQTTEVNILAPPADLSRLIEHVWVKRGTHTTSSDWRVVPDASPHMIAVVTAGYSRAMSVRIVGARSRGMSIDATRRVLTVGLRFRPGALSAMVDASAEEFVDRSIAVDDVFHRDLLSGLELSADAPAPLIFQELIRLTRRACRRRTLRTIVPDPVSPWLKVGELARSLGEPTRSMRARAHREIGLSPKRMLRVLRLHSALHAARDRARSWSEVAHLTGYADQAHLTRELRALIGETPSTWQARGSAVLFKTPRRAIV